MGGKYESFMTTGSMKIVKPIKQIMCHIGLLFVALGSNAIQTTKTPWKCNYSVFLKEIPQHIFWCLAD